MRTAQRETLWTLLPAVARRGRRLPAWARWAVVGLLVAAVAAFAPQVLGPYHLRLAVLTVLYFCLALGYNVVITEAGQFHLGFVAYFAVGAYTVGIATTHFGWTFREAAVLSVPVVLVFSLALGVLLLRFRGDYLSVVSLAAAEILRLVLANWRSVTGGYLGIPGIAGAALFGRGGAEQADYLYLAVLLAAGGVIGVRVLKRSGAGLAWRGIRQNERAIRAVGVRVDAYKQLSFAVGGLLAGLAGALYASYQTIVDPSLAAIDGTILVLTIVILGGGSTLGLLASAAVLTILPEATRLFDEYRLLLLGVFFVAVMNWRPQGFAGRLHAHFMARDAHGGTGAPAPRWDSNPSPAWNEPVLAVEHVSRRFGGLMALKDVSLSVRRGEILGVIGPNGAGKTTLFNVIAGALAPSGGRVRFGGVDITRLPPHRRSRLGIARTFQTIEFCPALTCLENVMLARLPRARGLVTLAGLPAGERVRAAEVSRALWALEIVGLQGRADDRAEALPYADRRRLEIARALASDPDLLLLDEPAAGMNPAEAKALVGLVQRVNTMGITVVLIEHNVRLVRAACGRVVVLSSGEIIAESDPEDLVRTPAVVEAYLGRRFHDTAGR